ncbi:NADH-quinone oxidoreductase subunit J [Sporanaerobium hydrogeniformans]|uniref:NADH-quinone oxidoreductase subunit J n=1 Tax=Sporanaerobium hydrogeniformans TaxID=3072179 RepID=A0AC61DB51_9FIRM|nr:4Fe-4S dicluster domain-containing protein [Sporanaerobium hydrogeniformans]PHV70272.1 NADH-quinone oxidoreductase subunit J [Sporanaerobium hydrogeniformans]
MNSDELKQIMKENGIVGAGGAGFPSYAKLDERADTLILNCAECEPLLKLHRQVLEKYAYEIVTTLERIAEVLEVADVIIAVKPSYKGAIAAVEGVIKTLKTSRNVRIGLLPETYPAGDEVVTIYETTGRVVPPGSIPISIGVTVFNVETILNVYKALNEKEPVIYKYITITGEVRNPITLKVPLGISVDECIEAAGGLTIQDPIYINGGPMTGRIVSGYDTINKTSNAILVMPPDQYIVKKRQAKTSVSMKRGMSACCQCQMCTDLCPRNQLGHPIRPHAFMQAATSNLYRQVDTFMETFYCSQCGLCEMYSCFQDLAPKTLIGECKDGLRKNGVTPRKDVVQKPVHKDRAFRGVSKERLTARLGIEKYDAKAPLKEEIVKASLVKIAMRQHIGTPGVPCVKQGEHVEKGQVIGKVTAENLGAFIHASISGTVLDVNDDYVTIKNS